MPQPQILILDRLTLPELVGMRRPLLLYLAHGRFPTNLPRNFSEALSHDLFARNRNAKRIVQNWLEKHEVTFELAREALSRRVATKAGRISRQQDMSSRILELRIAYAELGNRLAGH